MTQASIATDINIVKVLTINQYNAKVLQWEQPVWDFNTTMVWRCTVVKIIVYTVQSPLNIFNGQDALPVTQPAVSEAQSTRWSQRNNPNPDKTGDFLLVLTFLDPSTDS